MGKAKAIVEYRKSEKGRVDEVIGIKDVEGKEEKRENQLRRQFSE